MKITKQKSSFSILNNLYAVLNLSRLMTNVTIDRANNRSFPISSQFNRSEVPTFSLRVGHSKIFTFPPPEGQKLRCKVPINSPYSPTSARGAPFGEADDKCIRLTEILKTFPRVFCFPKSRINENGGKASAELCFHFHFISLKKRKHNDNPAQPADSRANRGGLRF